MANNRPIPNTGHSLPRMLMLLCLGCGAWFSNGWAAAASLTKAHQAQAQHLADQTPWPVPVRQSNRHPLGTQTLSIEKQERKPDDSNSVHWVNVYQFDYVRQQARLLVIHLRDQKIHRQALLNTVHLPLNDNEIDYAIRLLSAKTALIQRLQAEQLRRGQTPFQSLAELDVKASIFEPMDSSHPCAQARCALLSLFDHTHTVFSQEPLVLLQTSRVQTLNHRQ